MNTHSPTTLLHFMFFLPGPQDRQPEDSNSRQMTGTRFKNKDVSHHERLHTVMNSNESPAFYKPFNHAKGAGHFTSRPISFTHTLSPTSTISEGLSTRQDDM